MDLIEWFNMTFNDVGGVVEKGVSVALIGFIAWKAFKAGGALAAVLAALLSGAIIYYAITNGYVDLSRLISAMVNRT